MAEAHSAVAFQFIVTDDGLSFNYNKDVINAVLHSGVRSWKRLAGHFKNSLLNRVYPFHPSSWFFVVIAVFVALYFKLETTTRMFGHFETFFKNYVGLTYYHVPACLSLALTIWFIGVIINKILLRLLLSWKGFMYMPPGKVSLSFKIWVTLLKLASSSRVRLYSYQDALSSLPVPGLRDTIDRYLKSVKPLMPEEQYKSLATKAENFASSYDGKKLQFFVKLKSYLSSNYVSDWWEEYVYLANRSPLVCNSNYYGMGNFTRNELPYFDMPRQSARCAMMCILMLEMRRQTVRETRKPLMIRDIIPLCSAQYERQFNSTRIPLPNKDKIIHWKSSNHIVVYHRGRYYKCLIVKNGNIILPCELEFTLEYILQDTSEPQPGEMKLAALTAGPRDDWADARNRYFSSGVNKTSLDAIERAAFCVSLDDVDYLWRLDLPAEECARKMSEFSKTLLHGKCYDRWFDKSFSLCVAKNSQFGCNCEHSWADAPVNAQKVEQCITWEANYNTDKKPFYHYANGRCHGQPSLMLKPQRLEWKIPEECEKVIERSYQIALQLANDTDMYVLFFQEYGKGLMKKARISPDAYVQMVLQLAIYMEVKKFCLTYEASMTRLYRDGRTETVRSCTSESCDFVLAMVDESGKFSQEERLRLMNKACDNHQFLYRDAMTGKGVDRHLFSLYVLSKFLHIETPFLKEVLSEPWRLSTSQTGMSQVDGSAAVFSRYIPAGGGFGPVADDGYGVSYIFSGEDNLFFHISSKHSCASTSSEKFSQSICRSMMIIKTLVESQASNKKIAINASSNSNNSSSL